MKKNNINNILQGRFVMEISDLWLELKTRMSMLEKDMEKSIQKKNVSAGLRVRRQLRKVRLLSVVLTRKLRAADKKTAEERKLRRATKK